MFNKYNSKVKIQSLYCYEGTEVYINKFGIMDQEVLSHIESDLTSNRLLEMSESPIRGRFGTTHFLNIHKYIFQDIYPFAGKLREEDIWKGNTFFCKHEYIKSNLNDLFKKLKNENHLTNMNREEFIKRLAFYMSELNIIHPFREGNGRAIREFVRILAVRNGYEVSWYNTKTNELLEAAILAVDFDYSKLIGCLNRIIS